MLRTDGRTDEETDTARSRVACPGLKTRHLLLDTLLKSVEEEKLCLQAQKKEVHQMKLVSRKNAKRGTWQGN